MTTSTAQTWEAERPRLTALAYGLLGSWHDAEDVVAQSWLRLAQQESVDRPQAWLTTVVTRLAIDAGRRARVRRESYVGEWLPEPVATARLPADVVETRSLLGLAMLRLLDRLGPEERAIFVLREAFDLPYAEIGACVGRSPAACRQVVSRARAVLRADGVDGGPRPADERQLMTALVNAVSAGDPEGVVALLAPDCTLVADSGGAVPSARWPVRGSDRVARFLMGVHRHLGRVEELDVNGGPALLFHTDRGSYLYVMAQRGGRVCGIQAHANPDKLAWIRPR